jgi:molybdate transport repressor ModE-like protein
VVEKTRGGITGGKTVLTPQGKIIVTAFDKFHRNHDAAITKALNDMLIEIRQNVGEHN